jgi:hypothetical protein
VKKESFCNRNCELTDAIPQLLLTHIFRESLKGEIENRYNDMRNNFDLNYEEWQDCFTTKGKPFRGYDGTTAICIPTKETHFPELQDFNRIGLDLPTWSNINTHKPTVMFVAQDPLRSDWYRECNDIVVSSPFGVQDATHRCSRHGEVYFSIFSEIVEKGYGIYLTDTKKFYLKGDNSASYTKKQTQIYDEILKQEIEIVKPKIIVTFGKQAQRSIIEIDGEDRLLPLIHPSGASRGHIKKRYKTADCSNKKIAEIYIETILYSLANNEK